MFKKQPLDISDKDYASKTQAADFRKFCAERNFVGLSLKQMETDLKDGKLTMTVLFNFDWSTFDWSKLTKKSYKRYIKPTDSCFAIWTGKISGLTVIVCCTQDSFDALTADFPQLLETFIVKTCTNAYHIYCRYDAALETITDSHAFHSYPNVNILTNGVLVFAPPTTSKNYNTGDVESFQIFCDAKTLQPFPEDLKQEALSRYSRMFEGMHAISVPDE